jgi:aryl-alcohol dehydrogenase-like predicted oxidoreductase
MNVRRLGHPDPVSIPIGLGTHAFADRHGEGDMNEASSIARVHQALGLGVVLLDTADHYGGGQVERLIGRALANRRAKTLISTRGGALFTSSGHVAGLDASPRHLRHACDASLRRLGIECVDLYYLDRHSARANEQLPVEDSIGQLAELVKAGKIRYIGMTAPSAQELRRAHAVYPITAISGEYSLCHRRAELELVPAAHELGIAFVAGRPLGRGLLTGHAPPAPQIDAGDPGCGDPPSSDSQEPRGHLVRAAQEIATHLDLSLSRLSLAWLLSSPGVIPVPSTRNPLHLEMNAAAADVRLNREICEQLAALFPPTLSES